MFGERQEGYDYPVVNEREARASAGIMFFLGLLSLLMVFGAFGKHTLFWAELFSITFIFEFVIRMFVSVRYAPYMLLGSLIVSHQQPEWVEAAPKKFAWTLGLLLGLTMAYFIIMNIASPARFLSCVLCLILLFLESSFGICLGCMLYHKLGLGLKGNCPGGSCEIVPKRFFPRHWLGLLISGLLFYGLYHYISEYRYFGGDDFPTDFNDENEWEDEEKTVSEQTMQVALPAKKKTVSAAPPATKKDCTPPQWAIDMGHREIWKKHNGCE